MRSAVQRAVIVQETATSANINDDVCEYNRRVATYAPRCPLMSRLLQPTVMFLRRHRVPSAYFDALLSVSRRKDPHALLQWPASGLQLVKEGGSDVAVRAFMTLSPRMCGAAFHHTRNTIITFTGMMCLSSSSTLYHRKRPLYIVLMYILDFC